MRVAAKFRDWHPMLFPQYYWLPAREEPFLRATVARQTCALPSTK